MDPGERSLVSGFIDMLYEDALIAVKNVLGSAKTDEEARERFVTMIADVEAKFPKNALLSPILREKATLSELLDLIRASLAKRH